MGFEPLLTLPMSTLGRVVPGFRFCLTWHLISQCTMWTPAIVKYNVGIDSALEVCLDCDLNVHVQSEPVSMRLTDLMGALYG